MNTLKKNRDGLVLVDTTYHWKKIDANTSRGVKLQLVNRSAGSATYGILEGPIEYQFFTHWAPVPTFDKDEK